MGGVACQAVVDEFNQAVTDIKANPQSAAVWQVIISKYHPTFLGSCKQAIQWSEQMVSKWLENNMCAGDKNKVKQILETFSNHQKQKSHSRHISKQECIDIGLNIRNLEDDKALQDAVLTTHHMFMHTFSNTATVKIIENHMGVAYIENQANAMPPIKLPNILSEQPSTDKNGLKKANMQFILIAIVIVALFAIIGHYYI